MGYKGKSLGNNKYRLPTPVRIDLHGKTVLEAQEVVKKNIVHAQDGEVFHFIVGKGTGRGISILGPAIKKLLESLGQSWRPARLADGGEGVLVVIVQN